MNHDHQHPVQRRARGPRIAVVLAMVAAVPLAGLATTTWHTIQDAQATQHAAQHTQRIAGQAADLTGLQSAVFDEMVAAAIATVADELDVPPALLAGFLGSNPSDDLTDARARTDELLAQISRIDLADTIGDSRSRASGLSGTLAAYGDALSATESALANTLAELTSSTAGGTDAAELTRAVQLLEHAIDTRSAVADEFYGYFAIIFDVRDPANVELARLIQAQARYDTSLDALTATPNGDMAVRVAAEQLNDDTGMRALADAIDTLINTALVSGIAPPAPLTFDTVLGNIDGFTAVYDAASAASTTTSALLDAALDDTLDAANNVETKAAADIEDSYLLAVALSVMSAISALLAARFIVRPLRRLERHADRLHDPTTPPATELTGPAEVRTATAALRDASTHLDLVTRQTRALAVGELDADVLHETAPGNLGNAVQHAVRTLRDALAQQDEFRRRLAHEATHDGLTKLANRNASLAQLTRSLARTHRTGSQLAVLFIDLDRFKDVNDQHGHHAGDTVLTTAANRLVSNIREGDHIGRLGGDEFIVIAEPVSDADEAIALARRLRDTLAEPIEVGGITVTVGASIGIALADGTDLTADELLRDADLAVYRAKTIGRGGIEICNEDLRVELAETIDHTLAIRHAIEHDELLVHYQPIIDTTSGELRALEALVRWQRPGHPELIPPALFIGVAERSNLIVELDRWVITAVTRQIRAWNDDPYLAHIPVAINVSRRHLAHDHFVQHVLQPIDNHQINPSSIIIEVTESALLDNLGDAAVKLEQLRHVGIRVAIDDFGTGYTSLAHLRSLPVDILKIDRSFTAHATTNQHEASIVKLIIDTGHLLGATITAEGIENTLEADTLSALGSDNLQGFYFARPQPPEQLRRSLDTAPLADPMTMTRSERG